MKIKKTAVVRFVIQAVFFVIAPAVFALAFGGVKQIGEKVGSTERVTFSSPVTLLLALILYTILFGRFFCGYACAFGSFGDWLYGAGAFIRKKLRIRILPLPVKAAAYLKYVKYAVLAFVFILSLAGFPGLLAGKSPWAAFAAIRAGRITANPGLLLLGVLILCMIWTERFFCRFLCPLGAVFSITPRIPLVGFHKNTNLCGGCGNCTKHCPAGLSLGEKEYIHSGECLGCGTCVSVCPKENMSFYMAGKKVRYTLILVIQSLLMVGLFFALGIIVI